MAPIWVALHSSAGILITAFVANAWDNLFYSGEYNNDKYFEQTGCLVSLDGSEDSKVKVQGLPNYVLCLLQHVGEDAIDMELPGDNASETLEAQVPDEDLNLEQEQEEVEAFIMNETVDLDLYEDVAMIDIWPIDNPAENYSFTIFFKVWFPPFINCE